MIKGNIQFCTVLKPVFKLYFTPKEYQFPGTPKTTLNRQKPICD